MMSYFDVLLRFKQLWYLTSMLYSKSLWYLKQRSYLRTQSLQVKLWLNSQAMQYWLHYLQQFNFLQQWCLFRLQWCLFRLLWSQLAWSRLSQLSDYSLGLHTQGILDQCSNNWVWEQHNLGTWDQCLNILDFWGQFCQ